MNFIAPLAFALTALLPIIVALYFLKLRREEQRVSSTYLWRTLVRDTAANAPWQRLKPNLLLLLQLLFLIALILALARPFVWSEAAAGSHLILVIDTSASMAATDVQPNRLAAAVASARRLIASLPASARVTVIDAGAEVRIPVSGATDRGAALAALDALRPGTDGADFSSALTMAAAMAAREPDSQVAILSDGGLTIPEHLTIPGRVSYIPIGADQTTNQAIGAFSLQAEAGGRQLSAFVQIVNYSASAAQRRLVLLGDGRPVAARDLSLSPGAPQAFTFPNLPADARVFEARLEGQDMLAADDHAWAVPPAVDKVAVRVVGQTNRFLETALRLLPNVEVKESASVEAKPLTGSELITPTASAQLTIFDSTVPTGTLPSGSSFFIAPLRSTEFFSVTGKLEAPVPTAVVADDPLLRNVDLRDVAVQDAARVALPPWGRAVIIDGKTSAPLLVLGEMNGRQVAVLAFDLRHSDLPLRVAFPILMANLVDALVPGGAAGIPASLEPGRPLSIPVPPQVTDITVRAPDGSSSSLTPAGGRVLFQQTGQLGVYQVTAQEGGTTRPLGQFAVNLFNGTESDIRVRASLPIAGTAVPGAAELPRARDEWWQPLAWAALVLLVVEWLVAHRGQVVQLVRRQA